MRPPPPKSTPDSLFPYTTLFRALVVDHEAPRHLFITYAAALEGFATRHRADGADGRGCRALRRAVAVEIRANGRIEQVAAKAVRGKAIAVRTGQQRPGADALPVIVLPQAGGQLQPVGDFEIGLAEQAIGFDLQIVEIGKASSRERVGQYM